MTMGRCINVPRFVIVSEVSTQVESIYSIMCQTSPRSIWGVSVDRRLDSRVFAPLLRGLLAEQMPFTS